MRARALFLGDTDADGRVTAYDARMILRTAVGLEKPDRQTLTVADIDRDGRVTAADARLALRTGVGLEKNVVAPTLPGFTGYKSVTVDVNAMYTYEKLCADLAFFRTMFPDVFSYTSLCKTADGRDLWCIVIGTGNAKKQIVADAGIHGTEYLNPAAVMSAVEYYLRSYDTVVYNGKTVRQLLADTDLYILPMFNPDGIAISQFGLSGLKTEAMKQKVTSVYNKNVQAGNTELSFASYLRLWKANANGVDLNRNYSFEISGKTYDNGVRMAANEDYKGNPCAPENETAAYRALLERLKNPVAVVSFHSQGSLIYWKCGQSALLIDDTQRLAETVEDVTGYYLDPDDSFVGASTDWAMVEKFIPAVTVESGRGTNPLPISDQPGIAAKLKNVLLAVAQLYN